MRKMPGFINTPISLFFPNTCASCGDIIREGECLCNYCNEMIDRCDPLKRCIKCGQKIGGCDCRHRVFRFQGCVAPFYASEIAKKAMYSFKFKRKLANLDFFAREMALCVKNEYRDIVFDGICYVPMTSAKKRRRGFNQSRDLALKISEIMGIRLFENELSCRKSSLSQHKLSYNERFNNVKELYSWNYANTGRTLLLVDDIRTTGATLDECTNQLLLSGADRVYCVTGLINRAVTVRLTAATKPDANKVHHRKDNYGY